MPLTVNHILREVTSSDIVKTTNVKRLKMHASFALYIFVKLSQIKIRMRQSLPGLKVRGLRDAQPPAVSSGGVGW